MNSHERRIRKRQQARQHRRRYASDPAYRAHVDAIARADTFEDCVINGSTASTHQPLEVL